MDNARMIAPFLYLLINDGFFSDASFADELYFHTVLFGYLFSI